jgi:hypothetical protein
MSFSLLNVLVNMLEKAEVMRDEWAIERSSCDGLTKDGRRIITSRDIECGDVAKSGEGHIDIDYDLSKKIRRG